MTPEELEALLAQRQQQDLAAANLSAATPETASGIIPSTSGMNQTVEQAHKAANANAQAAGTLGPASATPVAAPPPEEPDVAQQYAENTLSQLNSLPRGGGSGGPPTVQTTTNNREIYNYTPDQLAAQQQAVAEKADAEATIKKNIAEKGAAEAMAHRQSAENMEAAANKFAEIEQEKEIARQQLEGEMESLDRKIEMKSAELAQHGADPWSNKSVGQRILGGIALFLGGAAAAQGNPAVLNMIQQRINEESNAMKGYIGHLKDKKKNKEDNFDAFTSELVAKRQQLWQDAINKTQVAAERMQDVQAQQNASLLIAEMQKQAGMEKAAAIQQMADKTVVNTVQKLRTGGGGGMNPKKQLELQAAALKNAKMIKDIYDGDTKQDKTSVAGLGKANSETDAKELSEKMRGAAEFLSSVKELSSMEKNMGFGKKALDFIPGASAISEDLAASESAALSAAQKYAKAMNGSRVSDADIAIAQKSLPEPSSVLNPDTRYKTMMKSTIESVRTAARAAGLDPDMAERIVKRNAGLSESDNTDSLIDRLKAE